MKKILIILFVLPLMFSSCGDEFLDSENLTQKDQGNYYSNPRDISEALAAVYSCLPIDNGANHPVLIGNLLSDDCFSGGGTNDVQTIGTDQFTFQTEDQYNDMYVLSYTGISRANFLIKAFDDNKPVFEDADALAQANGEAYFLRAYLYFRLSQFFGDVPLKITTDPEILSRNPASEVYAQIASDLIKAIELLPATNYTAIESSQRGRATKWAAQSLMARVFLFYTGYYNQSTLPTVDGAGVQKSQVIAWLDDVIGNSGHGLVDDFRSLWPYSSLEENVDDYFYANDVEWVGDGSKETVFAVKYSPNGDWGNTGRLSYANQHVLYTSVRATQYPPFGAGWGIGSVNPQLSQSFEANDPRRTATIIDNTDANEGTVTSNYSWGGWNCANETGLWNKKYTSIVRDIDDPATVDIDEAGDGTYSGMFYFLYGGNNNMQLWNMQDDIIIRFADVLLMHSELTETATGINTVRTRVGLDPVGYSLDAVKAERRHELALEGLRYYDLLRWGDAKAAIEAASGVVQVKTDNVDVTYQVSFDPAKAFVKFPETQVRLSNGNIQQTPGWE